MIKLTQEYPLTSKGRQTISNLSSAVSLTVPDGACVAEVQAQQADVLYTADGSTTPAVGTPDIGTLLEVSKVANSVASPIKRLEGDLESYSFVELTTGAVLQVEYFAISGS